MLRRGVSPGTRRAPFSLGSIFITLEYPVATISANTHSGYMTVTTVGIVYWFSLTLSFDELELAS